MPLHSFLAKWKVGGDMDHIRSFYRLVLLLGIAVFTYGLSVYVITGSYARYVQDDYCYAAILGRQGFWQGQLRSYLEETTYNGNRFSLTLLMGISEKLGRFSVGFLPGLAVILWVSGFVLALRNANRPFGITLSWIETLFLAEALVYLALAQAPNLAQVLYWRPGLLPYLAPLVGQTYLVAAILGVLRRGRSSLPALAGMALLALLSAGFSETAATFQVGLCGLIFLAAFIGLRAKKDIAVPAFRSSWAALLGTLLGMLLLIISPAGKRMQDMHYGTSQGVINTIAISLDSISYFIKYTLYRVTVPTIFTFLFFVALGFSAFSSRKLPQHFMRNAQVFFFASPLIVLLLLICITAPSAYVQGGYPELRALIGARLLIVIWLAVLGVLCGMLARKLLVRTCLEIVYIGIAGLLFAALILHLSFITPGSFQEPAYPDIRSFFNQSTLFFVLIPLIGLVGGVTLGLLFRRFSPGKTAFELALLVLFAGMLLQPLRTARSIFFELPYYQKRAALWDQRDAEIRRAEEDGQRNIRVRSIDSLAGVSELQENPGNWINRCAAWLYGMESIRAIPK